jgi:predicted esterase
VLVLLHGLGETASEALGLLAWSDRYGLESAWQRLSRPPLARTLKQARYLTDPHAEALNASLQAHPFEPPVVVCPVTPNPRAHPSAATTLDVYGHWLTETLLPAVKAAVPGADLDRVGLDGCSLGGYVALEVFLRHPGHFSTLGTVQAAYGMHRVKGYADGVAEALGEHGAIPVHVETSTRDPYREANEALVKALAKRGVHADLEVLPGPHSQPWLREVGTVEMLRWHSLRLRGRTHRRRQKSEPPPT